MGCRKLQFEDQFSFITDDKTENKGFSFVGDLPQETSENNTPSEDLQEGFTILFPDSENSLESTSIDAPEYTAEKNRYKADFYNVEVGLNLYAAYMGVNGVDPLGLDLELDGPFWDAVSKGIFVVGNAIFFPGTTIDKTHHKITDKLSKTSIISSVGSYGIRKIPGRSQRHLTGFSAELARLSADVYNIEGAPEGWSRLVPETMGLEPSMFYDDAEGKLGFYATLYKRNSDNVYVLAFRGTHDLID